MGVAAADDVDDDDDDDNVTVSGCIVPVSVVVNGSK